MAYKNIIQLIFTKLFDCEPLAINDWEDLIQVKYEFSKINSKKFLNGLSALQKTFKNSYVVRVLIVYPGILQIIIGTDADSLKYLERNSSDFLIKVCG